MESRLQYAGATLVEPLVGSANDSGAFAGVAAEQHRPIVIAFVGMPFEAKIAAGPGVKVLRRNARSELENVVHNATRQGYRGIVSFGVAGGLDSRLRAGNWVVASAIQESQTIRETDASWSSRLKKRKPKRAASSFPIPPKKNRRRASCASWAPAK